MEFLDPRQLKEFIANPISWLLLIYVAKEFWSLAINKAKDTHHLVSEIKSELAIAVKENSLKMHDLTMALTKLETRLEYVDSLVLEIPKIQSDIEVLNERVRNLGLKTIFQG